MAKSVVCHKKGMNLNISTYFGESSSNGFTIETLLSYYEDHFQLRVGTHEKNGEQEDAFIHQD